MEYNFERIDIHKLLKVLAHRGRCDDPVAKVEGLIWEQITVTSTFNISKMSPDKIPAFKNMGCFNHYKNKNQVVIFGGVVSNTQTSLTQRSFVIDLEQHVISKGNDSNIKNG